MRLHSSDCTNYYCKQLGGGVPYFSGPPIQRGYGFLGDVFRQALPVLREGGKYFGRKLLSAGTQLASDVLSGKSFGEAAKSRLNEMGSNIKDDVLQKLQKGSGIGRRRKTRAVKRSAFDILPLQTKKKKKKVIIKDIFS